MLDIKLLRTNPDAVRTSLEKRHHYKINVDDLISSDVSVRDLQTKTDELRKKRNDSSQLIAKMKKEGQDTNSIQAEVKEIGETIKKNEAEAAVLEAKIIDTMYSIPNLVHESVPVGKSEEDNQEVRKWGEVPSFDFEVKTHDEIGKERGFIDFERAVKLAGARFTMMRGSGARLERALINFMLDLHTTEHGYEEVLPPFISNRETLTANGNLPKFEEDLFAISNSNYFLIPTAEVPLTNIYRGEILEKTDLPKYFTAYTACFRSEAGAAGKDTKGLIRVHQFSKVELVKIVEPENSFDELEKMVKNAEKVLQLLELPYRVLLLCSGDQGFNSAKTYDLEVWFPTQNKYREISSCSNCTDFQSRRGALRYKLDPKSNTIFPHTLNGSGLAVGRALAAILEVHQQKDGTIKIPKALQSYMGNKEFI
ncbi:MAG: serine--tRNA ligase [Cyanobacteriota bacterium]